MIRSCATCGKGNRVPPRHFASRGRCGSCKGAIEPLSEPLNVDTGLFDQVIRGASVPVLVDFWAPWCGPCRTLGPELKKAARSLAGKAIVLKVNTDEESRLAARYHVSGIPNLILFNHGELVHQHAGLVSEQHMMRWVEDV